MLVTQAHRFELDPNNKCRSALASHAGAARFAYNWGLDLVSNHLAARRALVVLAIRQGSRREEAEEWADGPARPTALDPAGAAAGLEPGQGWGGTVVGGELQGVLLLRARRPGGALDAWSKSRRGTQGTQGRLPPVQDQEQGTAQLQGEHWGLRGDRRSACALAPHRGHPHRGADGQAGRTPRRRGWPDALGHGVGESGALICELHLRDGPPCATAATRAARRCGRGRAVPGRGLHRRGDRQSQAPLQVLPAHGQAPATVLPSGRSGQQSDTIQALAAFQGAPRSCSWQGHRGTYRRLRKLTTSLAKAHEAVVVEDLNVAGMTASAKGSRRWRGKAGLNRVILDAAPGELRRQLAYKATWYDSRLVVADRWYPSSKTCSRCKAVKAKLSLSERTYRCERCGLVADRDLNAAANLASLVESLIGTGTASGAGTGRGKLPVNAQGEERFMSCFPPCADFSSMLPLV